MFASFLAIPILLSVVGPNAGYRAATATPRGVTEVRRATVEAKITLVRRERIRSFWGRMITRIEAAIGRLELLIERMERRIAVIEEGNEDIDLTSPKADVAQAKLLLEEAKDELAAAKDAFEEMLESEDPKAALGKVIENVRNIKSNLVEIHRLLVQAIGEIRGLRVGTPTGTTTP